MALVLLAGLVTYTDAVLSFRLHDLNVAFYRRTDGNIALTFKPDITQSQVEKAVVNLDRCKESQKVRDIYVFGKGVNSTAIHELIRLQGVQTFYADGCTFSGDAMDDITAWRSLKRVSLYNLKFDPRVLCHLATLGHLERIEFDGKYLTAEVIKCLSEFEHLNVISLAGRDLDSELIGRLKTALPRVTVLTEQPRSSVDTKK